MNVLVIAPDFGLPAAADEVRAISLALHPVILNGNVARRDVLDALRSHDLDIIWFVSHGDANGVQLSDGHLSVGDLTAVVRASGARLVVLNTCSSRLVGLELHYELGVSVITTQAEIGDLSAFQTGALLAQALADGLGIVEAFEASRPGQGKNYLLFHEGKNYLLFHDQTKTEAAETKTILMLNDWGARLSAKIDALERRMDREMGALRQDISRLSGHVETAVRLPPWHRTVFVLAFGLLSAPVPLFYSQVRELLDVGWQTALLIAASAYVLSAMLWSYMWLGGRRSDD